MERAVRVVFAVMLIGLAITATAQDRLVSYQGFLTDDTGMLVPDGTYQLTFGMYYDSTGGTPYWNEVQSNVYVSGGAFSVMLGSVTPLGASVLGLGNLFLQIQVGADPPIQPRTRLGSVPKAAVSDRVDGDIQTGPGYTHFKDPDGSTAMTIGTEGKGGPGFLSMYNPSSGFEGQTLVHLRSAPEGAQLRFYPPGDVPPDPCIFMGVAPQPFRTSLDFFDPSGAFPHDPYITMGLEPTPFAGAQLEFHDASSGFADRPLMRMGFDPSPFNVASLRLSSPEYGPPPKLLEMRVHDSTGDWQSDFAMYSSGYADKAVIKMGVEPSPFKASIKMFNPQPEPPVEVFSLITDFAGRADEVVMELTDSDTDIQTKLTPGRVKVGSDVSDVMAKGELWCGNDTTVFYIQGMAGPGPGPMIAMLASSTEVKMGIGTQTPSEELHVVGDICYTGTIGACSDGRYKRNIDDIGFALDKVSSLRGVNYRWKTDQYPNKKFDQERHLGFIAQEVRQVVPEIVQEHDDGTLSVDYGRLTPLLVEAIKDLKAENDELRKRLDRLESK